MINLTDRPIIVGGSVKLSAAIRSAVKEVQDWIVSRHGVVPERRRESESKSAVWKAKNFAFIYTIDVTQIPKRIDPAFIQNVFEFINCQKIRKKNTSHLHAALKELGSDIRPPAHALQQIRQGFCAVLLLLWCKKVLLLPLSLRTGSLLAIGTLLQESESEVIRYFRSYRDVSADSSSTLSSSGRRQLSDRIPPLIWATNWHRFEEVEIDEVGLAQRATQFQLTTKRPRHAVPYQLMIAELYMTAGDRLTFGKAEIDLYAIWAMSPKLRNGWSFKDFRAKPKEILEKIEGNPPVN